MKRLRYGNPKPANAALMVCLALMACGPSIRQSSSDIWKSYDIRTPVPASSSVPVSRAQQYQPPVPYSLDSFGVYGQGENDAYYYRPPSYNPCGQDNLYEC